MDEIKNMLYRSMIRELEEELDYMAEHDEDFAVTRGMGGRDLDKPLSNLIFAILRAYVNEHKGD